MKSKSIGSNYAQHVTIDASIEGVDGEETMFKLPFPNIRGGGEVLRLK